MAGSQFKVGDEALWQGGSVLIRDFVSVATFVDGQRVKVPGVFVVWLSGSDDSHTEGGGYKALLSDLQRKTWTWNAGTVAAPTRKVVGVDWGTGPDRTAIVYGSDWLSPGSIHYVPETPEQRLKNQQQTITRLQEHLRKLTRENAQLKVRDNSQTYRDLRKSHEELLAEYGRQKQKNRQRLEDIESLGRVNADLQAENLRLREENEGLRHIEVRFHLRSDGSVETATIHPAK